MHQNPFTFQSTGQREARATAASSYVCLSSIAQECWIERDCVYFAGTPLDRDVFAPFSAHTPEEHRYILRCVSWKQYLLNFRTMQRKREDLGIACVRSCWNSSRVFKCSTQRSAVPVQTVCYVVKQGWAAALNVTFPVVKPIRTCQNLVHNERKSSP